MTGYYGLADWIATEATQVVVRTARKAHCCTCCDAPIPPGDRYVAVGCPGRRDAVKLHSGCGRLAQFSEAGRAAWQEIAAIDESRSPTPAGAGDRTR